MTWQLIDEKLKSVLSEEVHALWIKPLQCKRFDDQVVELTGPDRFFCSWVTDNFLADIKSVLSATGKHQATVLLTVDANQPPNPAPAVAGREQLRLPSMPKAPSFVRALNPRYKFSEFIVGNSNEVAHSACQALAHGDSSFGNCIYINASTGLGKSHLTHAVAHHILEHNPSTRLNYLTAQQLTAEMVRCLQTKSMDLFKETFHNSDILLMENMQTLTGKVKTQEELSTLFDMLLESGKSIIFTGSRTPKDIDDINPDIRSRLSSGLIATISEPNFETKMLIISQNAHSLNLELAEELAIMLADQIKGDIRQIKSALVGLKAKTKLRNMSPDLDMVKEVLADIVVQNRAITPESIRDFIAGQFKVNANDLQSKSRKKTVAFPRQISMYFSRKYTEMALSDIGKAFNRDHSTVVHSIRVITDSMNRNGGVRGQVELLDAKIQNQFFSF